MVAQTDELLAAIRATWPYLPRFADVNSWRMHYVDEEKGDPVVLLHGNPTWGFLYRDVIGPLVASGRRVIVRHDPFRFVGEADPRTARYARRAFGQSYRADEEARSDWGGPTGLSFAMSRTYSSSNRDEHVGVATAAGGIPHTYLSLANDPRAAGEGDLLDRELWAILRWMIAGVGSPWTVDDLDRTGKLYRVPASVG